MCRFERKENFVTSGELGELRDFKFIGATEIEIISTFILIVTNAEEISEVFH